MKPLFIILAQSTTGAVFLIIALLIVAAVIGYFTSWFYAKSVYTPVIKGLDADKSKLENRVESLKDDLGKLNGKAEKLTERVSKLEEDIAEKETEIKSLRKTKKTS
jgi:peptidoglycan hydrolase CwlO-like protein